MKKNNSYRYPKTQREKIDGKRHYIFDKEKLPSVTTILDLTQSAEKRESLQRWREREGEENAARIVATSGARGTAMHKILEKYILEQGYLDQTEVGKEDFGPIQKTDSSITISEHITQSKQSRVKKQNLSEYQEQDKDLRLLSYSLLVDKFNSKYKSLNENQRNLLKEYINNVSNTNSLKEFIDNEVVKIKKALKSLLPKVDDKITKIKLTEAIDYTDSATKGKVVKDKHVVALMRYYELIKEIKNVQTRQSK